MNFFTVSGIAAQRVSPGRFLQDRDLHAMLRTSFDENEEDDDADDEADDRAPFQQSGEPLVVARRARATSCVGGLDEQRLFFGHECSLR